MRTARSVRPFVWLTFVAFLGGGLPDPTLGTLATPLQVPVANLDTDVCWGATFAAVDVTANDAGLLKAKATN